MAKLVRLPYTAYHTACFRPPKRLNAHVFRMDESICRIFGRLQRRVILLSLFLLTVFNTKLVPPESLLRCTQKKINNARLLHPTAFPVNAPKWDTYEHSCGGPIWVAHVGPNSVWPRDSRDASYITPERDVRCVT